MKRKMPTQKVLECAEKNKLSAQKVLECAEKVLVYAE